jgi:hypothetical protein
MSNYTYISIATPSTTPATLTGDEKVFYIATEEGLYSNFGVGNISELSVIKSENGIWKVEELGVPFKKIGKVIKTGYVIPTDGYDILIAVSANNYTIIGRNIIDKATFKHKKIINDSGAEVNDNNSSYYDCLIPVYGNYRISINFTPQRFYLYGKNGELLARVYPTNYTGVTVEGSTYTFNPLYNSKEIYFIKIQISHRDIGIPEYPQVNYGNILFEYEDYKSNKSMQLYPRGYVYADNLDLLEAVFGVLISDNYTVESFVMPNVWEPEDVDDGYATPMGSANTTRENWAAAKKYTYYDFLADYYDVYLDYNISDDYRVNKKSLGYDSSYAKENTTALYELFEYDFCPKNYSKVVMISAGMNAIETSCIWGLATFMREVMKAEEPAMKFLKENVRFKVLPFICPSAFDENPLKYENINGVRINKNFSYRNNWVSHNMGNLKGAYPDSENETVILKKWINDYAGIADLYIDCHSDAESTSESYSTLLTQVICSDSSTSGKLTAAFAALKNYYISKGYASSEASTQKWVETGGNYPKTLYAYKECGIPSIMIEQYIRSTMYGSDGHTNNDAAGIKNYVAELRLYIYAILASEKQEVMPYDLPTISYKLKKNLT